MPFGALQITPGVNTEKTPTLNQAGLVSGNLVRFRQGLIEKIGGWTRFYPFSISALPRDLHAWQDLNDVTHLGVGSTTSLSVITGGTLTNITPQTTTTNTAPSFTTSASSPVVTITDSNITNPTTNDAVFIETPVAIDGLVLSGLYAITSVLGAHVYHIMAASNAVAGVTAGGAVALYTTTNSSAAVTVTLNAHGYLAGETFIELVSTTGGGITIFGTYLISSVTDANNFVITAATTATSSTSFSENSGNVRSVYYIAQGPVGTAVAYGGGLYGEGTYGYGSTGGSGTGTQITATDWTQDNWGEILLACPQNGPIYQWRPDSGFSTAQVIPTAPVLCGGIFVAAPFQILVAWGASKTGSPNPLGISWSTIGDYTVFAPLSTNSAGDYQIPTGSAIIGGLQAYQQGLIWTDLDLWSMNFIGAPNVFGFSKIMTGCGLIGSHAAGIQGSTVYWMSQRQLFFMPIGGAPQPLPCTVRDFIFQNLDTANAYKIRFASNSLFNTVAWHFPSLSGGTGENDMFVEYNVTENEWVTGQYPTTGRSCWIDQSVLGTPIGGTPTGLIYQHEQGYDGDGAALNPIFKTGYFVIGDGENFATVNRMIPDAIYTNDIGTTPSANLLITLFVTNYPNATPLTFGPFSANASQQYFTPRLRGRQVAVQVQSLDSGSFWRLGLIRYLWSIAGRR